MIAPFANRLFNTTAALHPGHADVAMAALADYYAGAKAGGLKAFGDAAPSAEKDLAPYEIVAGVAIIPVKGMLVQRVGPWPLWICSLLGVTGYDTLRLALLHALSNDQVDAVVLDVDSPGGEVAGCFDLVDTIFAARGGKPIWSILSENAFSAAYAIASAADRITVPRTGGTGSVGVIWMHVSFEDALSKAGIDVTLVTKGDLKGETSDVKKLSDGAFKRAKSEVLAVGDLFDRTVARNRGLKVAQVFDTQAGTFLGRKGVDVGFADAVMAPDAAFRALLDQLG